LFEAASCILSSQGMPCPSAYLSSGYLALKQKKRKGVCYLLGERGWFGLSNTMRNQTFLSYPAVLARLMLFISVFWTSLAFGEEVLKTPSFWDTQDRIIKPNVKGMPRLRFLTTTDFPPFSFIDKNKRLSGFHVDLARAICEELEILPVCQIQALPFDQLQSAVTGGVGDAVLGGISINAKTRESLTFSRPYFRLPARFVGKLKNFDGGPLIKSLEEQSVGIVERTAHAAFAKAQFGSMYLRLFETESAALVALQKDEVKAVFSDGLSLSFWLQGEQQRAQQAKSKPCCVFVGGPYLSQTYFPGELAVALAKGNDELEQAINFALRSINDKGKFEELYLRYFPISLF